jgi:hypothetical protein
MLNYYHLNIGNKDLKYTYIIKGYKKDEKVIEKYMIEKYQVSMKIILNN